MQIMLRIEEFLAYLSSLENEMRFSSNTKNSVIKGKLDEQMIKFLFWNWNIYIN